MEKLVYIGRIISVKPIENADRLEQLEVVCGKGGKWNAVSQKGNFKEGDLAEVYTQDSLLPSDNPRFSFMEKYHYRIKIQRLRGVPSEVLCLPLTVEGNVGDDITNQMGVLKYEKPLPLGIQGDIKDNFPNFIKKTDELNFNRVPHLVQALYGQQYYSSIKYDGTSASFYKYQDNFGVCSRNYELKESDTNIFWHIARKYELEKNILEGYAVQGELCGPGINGNALKLKEPDLFLFNLFNIRERRYISIKIAREMFDFCKWVPFKTYNMPFYMKTDDQLRCYAENNYDCGSPAEGVVIRPMEEQNVDGDRLSFKVINLLYKD